MLTKQKEKSNGNELNLFDETQRQIRSLPNPLPFSFPPYALPLSTPAAQDSEFFIFSCVISNDCVIIRSVTGTFNHRLVNQPFLFLHHPWLGNEFTGELSRPCQSLNKPLF